MSKLKGKNLKWGRCKANGQGCSVCDEIRNPLSRSTDKSISMDFERKLLEDESYREQWIEDEFKSAGDYFISEVLKEE